MGKLASDMEISINKSIETYKTQVLWIKWNIVFLSHYMRVRWSKTMANRKTSGITEWDSYRAFT